MLTAEKDKGWALAVCRLLEYLEQQPALLRMSDQLLVETQDLIQAAYDDCEFCHCYLSVAESADWTVGGIKKNKAAALGC